MSPQHQRRRRTSSTHMHDARNEGVIKIKHMASRGRKRNIRQQIIARSPHRPRSPLTHTATRARQPILKSRPVTEVLTRSPSHTSASHHQRKASHQPPKPRPSHTSPKGKRRSRHSKQTGRKPKHTKNRTKHRSEHNK